MYGPTQSDVDALDTLADVQYDEKRQAEIEEYLKGNTMKNQTWDYVHVGVVAACIFGMYLMLFALPASAQQRAWFSAGNGCEGGSKITYTVGVPFTISFCTQNEVPSCGFTAQLETNVPAESGLFTLLNRTLHPAFSDPNNTPPFPMPIVADVANSPYFHDLGGTGLGGDASLYDNRPLMVLTLVATPAAAAERRIIDLSPYSTIGIPIPNPQYPNQPCADGYDVPFGVTPMYLDADTILTPWTRTSYGRTRFVWEWE